MVETPGGSRNKYAFDPDQRVFILEKVLPEAMVFPHNFGFIPSTKAEDGDPVDVLLLMDEPAFAGCVVLARLIGVIEGEQTDGGKTERNDRLVAVAESSHTHSLTTAPNSRFLPEKVRRKPQKALPRRAARQLKQNELCSPE